MIEKTVGRCIFGVGTAALGAVCLVLRDQLVSSWTLPGDGIFLAVTSVALIAGGAAASVSSQHAAGAALTAVTYMVFAATFVPAIVAQPAVYATWGNVFYQLAPAAGALAMYAGTVRRPARAHALRHLATVALGLCSASFAVEQLEFFARTSSLVPNWLGPSTAFWTVATTVAFALAAVALVTGRRARSAARLEAAMLLAFVFVIWIPRLVADPHSHGDWSEGLETLVIAGAAWIVGATASSGSRLTGDGLER